MAATEFDHQGVENFFSLKTLSLCEGKPLKDLTRDSHKATKSLESFWVQNPKIENEAHSFLSKKLIKTF